MIVATELAVFLRGEVWEFGALLPSLSLDEPRESHENGLVSFRVGGWKGGWLDGGEGTVAGATDIGLFDGDSAEGDQGIAGRAFVMLLKEIARPAGSCSETLFAS